MSTRISHKDIKSNFEDLFRQRAKSKELKHDSLMLMAAFLSEIERVQEEKDISRKELASKIDISASYLTQVFRNKRPLNFLTLAKIKRELDLLFEIKAVSRAKSLPISYTVQKSSHDTGMYLIEGGQFYKFKQAIPA